MSLPTESEMFQRFTEHLIQAQEDAATLSHLAADFRPTTSRLWLEVSEHIKKMVFQTTKLAQGKLN